VEKEVSRQPANSPLGILAIIAIVILVSVAVAATRALLLWLTE
jgi:hypothetical protein